MDSRCDLLSFYNDPVTIQHPYPERCFCIRIIQLYKEVSYEQTNDLRYIQHFISKSCLCSELCFCCQPERRGRPLGAYFDTICEDPMFGTDTWEAAESTLQKQAALLAIKKNGLTCSDIQLLFAGDLLAQTSASSFGTADLKIPFYGLFGRAPLWENLFPLVQCVSTAGTENISSVQLPATLPAQKKNFVFPWDMEIKGLICYLDSHRCRSLYTWI